MTSSFIEFTSVRSDLAGEIIHHIDSDTHAILHLSYRQEQNLYKDNSARQGRKFWILDFGLKKGIENSQSTTSC
jgi:hypothetical protein